MNQKPKMEAPGAGQDYTRTVNLREFKAAANGGDSDNFSAVETMPLADFKRNDAKRQPPEEGVRIVGINRDEIELVVKHARDAHLKKFVEEMKKAASTSEQKIAQINLYNNFSEELEQMVEAQQLTQSEKEAALKSIDGHMKAV